MSIASLHFTLTSHWTPEDGTYRLVLHNQSRDSVSQFRLGLSGPFRLDAEAAIDNGRMVTTLSTYAEIVPPANFELLAGASWEVVVRVGTPLRHWTDGVVNAFVVLADGQTVSVATQPPARAGSLPRRRGTMALIGETNESISVVPWPRRVEVAGRRSAPDGLAPASEDPPAEAACTAFAALTEQLFPGEGLCRSEAAGGLVVHVALDDTLAAGQHRITFSSHGAKVEGPGADELLHGLITLGQMARGARREPQRFAFPIAGQIEDSPEHGFRGCSLDVARRFYSPAELNRFAAILAWSKLNRLHLHLSDDEAWRVEIDAYPRLAELGGWRGHGLALPPLLGSGPERTGGVYSKAEIRSLVAEARRWGVEIIPEIDIPGHCYALLQALPELADPGENGLYFSIQHFPNNCLNPAVATTYPALETILGELCDLFPGRWFHVGADEVPSDAWATSPLARDMRSRVGGDGPAPLQAEFLRRIQGLLRRSGKVTAAWEEAAHGGGIDRSDCYLVGWTKPEVSRALAAEGYDVVVAPAQAYYLDMANSAEWHEPGAGWAGWSSPENTYAFAPGDGWSTSERERLIGIQGCIWSEPMSDRAVFDRLVFPRLSAIAETAWTAPNRKDYRRFAAFAGLTPTLYGRREGDL